MKNIIANTWKIFKRNKEVFYLITIQPVMIFLLMSFLLPYTKTYNIAVINHSQTEQGLRIENALESLEGVKQIEVAEDSITEKLIGGNIELAVVIDENASAEIISLGDSEIETAVELCIRAASSDEVGNADVSVNAVPKKGLPISNSLGFMIFKTLTSGNLLAALLIQDRNQKMKDRILLSGMKVGGYISGMTFVYLILMMIGSAVYYVAALLMNFDFGMKNSLGFLLVLFTANILSVALYAFASTLVNKEDSLWFMASFVLLPMSLFSGVLFPYEFMPKAMQIIGACFPQRWVASGIEAIQQTGKISSAFGQMGMVLGLSAILFLCAVVRSTPKRTRTMQ